MEQMAREKTTPVILPDDMALMSPKLDFYGLNVYNRVVVKDDKENKPSQQEEAVKKGGNFLENGIEYYPQAAYDAISMFRKDYDATIPILITENGTYNCQEELVDGHVHDLDRIRYIQGFLEQIGRAVEEGADVRGYYLWSLLDNFEWNAATDCRFGLLHVDFETQERIWKDSAYWYRDVIARNGVG
jgi:beta-glucosidase